MQVDVEKKLFTVDDFYRMGEAGIFVEDERVELINGEVVMMSPIGDRHIECVMRATTVFAPAVAARRAIVSVQNPVRISNITMPLPDLLLLKPRDDFYRGKHTADDALLLIEVSDTSFRYDYNVKLPIYAAAGIRDFWIEDIQGNRLLVYREPSGNAYSTCLTLHHGDFITPLAFPDMAIPIDELLG